jgi:hypothetical protein
MENSEFEVLANKIVKYLNDATIVARLSHWNIRGKDFYEAHLMFERVYNDLSDLVDPTVEQLRACGFSPDFSLFSGPGIQMDYFDSESLVDLTIDYLMSLSGVIAAFYNFCENHSTDPRLVAIGNQMQTSSSVALNDLFLLQAWKGH